MTEYKIIRHPLYEEIRIVHDLDLLTVREIIGELSQSADFLRRHVLWNFGLDVLPLAFHEFDDVIGLLEKVYARAEARGKKVALVAQSSFARSVAEIFVDQARSLPMTLRVFAEPALARSWIEG